MRRTGLPAQVAENLDPANPLAVSSNDGPPWVAGPYVFVNQQVVDMSTRALAALPDYGKFASFEP